MSRLLRQGFIAALAPQGAPNADVVVTDLRGDRLCSIQVKTRQDKGADGGWHMKPKHETPLGDNHYYCFVDLGSNFIAEPVVYVIPNSVVAEVLSSTYRAWLLRPGRNGQKHNETTVRRLIPDYTKGCGEDIPYRMGWLDVYKENWDLLRLRHADPR